MEVNNSLLREPSNFWDKHQDKILTGAAIVAASVAVVAAVALAILMWPASFGVIGTFAAVYITGALVAAPLAAKVAALAAVGVLAVGSVAKVIIDAIKKGQKTAEELSEESIDPVRKEVREKVMACIKDVARKSECLSLEAESKLRWKQDQDIEGVLRLIIREIGLQPDGIKLNGQPFSIRILTEILGIPLHTSCSTPDDSETLDEYINRNSKDIVNLEEWSRLPEDKRQKIVQIASCFLVINSNALNEPLIEIKGELMECGYAYNVGQSKSSCDKDKKAYDGDFIVYKNGMLGELTIQGSSTMEYPIIEMVTKDEANGEKVKIATVEIKAVFDSQKDAGQQVVYSYKLLD